MEQDISIKCPDRKTDGSCRDEVGCESFMRERLNKEDRSEVRGKH